MERDVQCFVINSTPYAFYVQKNDLSHGEADKSPQTINANQSSTQVFHFHKTTSSLYGVTGSVTYKLQDGSILYLSFNCPYSQQGKGGVGNCFFYAGLENVPAGGTPYAIECDVLIGGNPMNPTNPVTGSTIVANIVISN